ncbi:hypothetical protein TNCV_5049691 [Trichonephila clavipes]|nr:hypothetical protein TNCV_5049691 [Trichonephila clavipes]
MVSNWVWMTEMDNSLPDASCHTSSTVLAEERRRESLSAIQQKIFSMTDRSGGHESQGHLAGLDDRAHLLEVRCQKRTDLRTKYRRFELGMPISNASRR